MSEVVARFASTNERNAILRGLLSFRAGLRQQGIVDGFQWLDGSFMEQVETLETRPPNDVDVVTFFALPAGVSQADLAARAGHLFDPSATKQQFKIDSYVCLLNQPLTPFYVQKVAYWYSMWSHRRNGLWKGFVQVRLDAAHDQDASDLLDLL